MWNERYADDTFFYGTEPNDFLKQQIGKLSGNILSIAEGEGRNAVFMAQHGLNVLGVDSSNVGLDKARKLAQRKGVSIQTEVADLADYTPAAHSFDGVVSIFAHLPPKVRKRLHTALVNSLKTGGILLLEGYSKAQINNHTGGPKNIDMLYQLDEIIQEFPDREVLLAQTIEREVIEGQGHTGLASVVQIIVKKL